MAIVDYDQPLKVEQIIAREFRKMERDGWPVNLDRLEEVLWHANENMQAIKEYTTPEIPMTPDDGGWKVCENPFTKAGKLSAPAKFVTAPMTVFLTETKKMVPFEHYLETNAEVVGPFCKVKWNVINIGSDTQVKKYLFTIGWKPTEWNINKKTGTVGSPKLTDDSFWSLKSDVGQRIALYLKLKHRRSMLEGFKKLIWYDPEGQARISQIVSGMTPTFRCTHKGIVNIPGEDSIFGLAIRSIFTAPKGYKQLGVDAKSCQLRMLCHYMGDYLYTETVLNGKKEDGTDIHSVNMKKTGGMLESRTQAKRFIYALLFGGGNPMLGAILGGDKADGARLREAFMQGLPALKNLLDALEDAWKEQGYLVALDGRRIYVRKKHQLLVYLLQAAEGVLMRWTLALLVQWGFFEKLDVKLAGFIHDEFQFHVREDQAELAADWVCKAFEAASHYLGLTVPGEGDPAIGDNWKDTH